MVDVRRIYFVQGVDGGPVKIGIANDPERRLRNMQAASPVPLRLLAVRTGTIFDERALHARLDAHRLHCEWFSPAEAVLAAVANAEAYTEPDESPRWVLTIGQIRSIVREELAALGLPRPITNDNAPTAHQPVSTVGASTEGV